MKVTNYVLLHSDESYSKLEFQVRQMLETGWQPLGGPFLTPDRVWFQAMVKPEPLSKLDWERGLYDLGFGGPPLVTLEEGQS